MRHHFQRPFAAGAGLAVIASVVALAPGQALAQEVITACVGKATNALRLLEAGGSCRSGEATVQWNVQGPQGPQGAQGPAGPSGPPGPQTMVGAYVVSDGSIGALQAPPGTTFSATRTGPGSYTVTVTGLGTGCPIPTVTPFGGVLMTFTGGYCQGGTVQINIATSNGADAYFMFHALAVVNANLKPGANARPMLQLGP